MVGPLKEGAGAYEKSAVKELAFQSDEDDEKDIGFPRA